jgi:hypothetical protein
MADLAQKIPLVAEADRGLLHASAGILAVAFLAKAAVWPLNFWLVPAYSAATAPVGALFAIMSKVGIYTVLRLWTLLFSAGAGASAWFGSGWLVAGGLATLVFGAIGLLGSQKLGNLAGFAVIVSSGTLLAAIGFGQTGLTAGALVLPAQLDAGRQRLVHAGRPDRALAQRRRQHRAARTVGRRALPQRQPGTRSRREPRRRGRNPLSARRSRRRRPSSA